MQWQMRVQKLERQEPFASRGQGLTAQTVCLNSMTSPLHCWVSQPQVAIPISARTDLGIVQNPSVVPFYWLFNRDSPIGLL